MSWGINSISRIRGWDFNRTGETSHRHVWQTGRPTGSCAGMSRISSLSFSLSFPLSPLSPSLTPLSPPLSPLSPLYLQEAKKMRKREERDSERRGWYEGCAQRGAQWMGGNGRENMSKVWEGDARLRDSGEDNCWTSGPSVSSTCMYACHAYILLPGTIYSKSPLELRTTALLYMPRSYLPIAGAVLSLRSVSHVTSWVGNLRVYRCAAVGMKPVTLASPAGLGLGAPADSRLCQHQCAARYLCHSVLRRWCHLSEQLTAVIIRSVLSLIQSIGLVPPPLYPLTSCQTDPGWNTSWCCLTGISWAPEKTCVETHSFTTWSMVE